jgi:hypothetical protein
MKVQITGASNFVNRMFEACGPYQWARELLQNSIEAGAKRVEFGIEWQAVRKLGAYRRTVVDDGGGMDAEQLRAFFSTLGAGSKNIGDIHANFGIGAKIATLPWNPEGLVVVSYKGGRGSMIWIVLDAKTEEYELVEFDTEDGKSVVIEPLVVDGVDWSALRPSWLGDHGTIVVLLGSAAHPHTILGMHGEDIKGASLYLNSRYADLSTLDVRVAEPRSDKKSKWPRSPDDPERRINVRRIWGARHYLETDPDFPGGRLAASGVVPLDGGRVQANWFLWQGERKSVHTYAREGGYAAIQYAGELYQLTTSKAHFRWFGIVEASVQRDVTILLEPQHYKPGEETAYGVYPDQSRNRLLFAGDGERGAELPITKWAYEFAEKMPAEIHAAIVAARGNEDTGTIDEEYRQRLLDRFGTRWTQPSAVLPDSNGAHSGGDIITQPATAPKGDRNESSRDPKGTDTPVRKKAERPTDPTGRALTEKDGTGRLKSQHVDIPKYRFSHKDEFEEPWHLALWSPHESDGPTVCINVDSPILQEIIEYRQSLYPEIYAEEIASEIRKAFGEIATCKIAHSQRLTKLIPEERLDEDYRNERALTVSLMGLIAEESLIVQRLKGRFKKTPTT